MPCYELDSAPEGYAGSVYSTEEECNAGCLDIDCQSVLILDFDTLGNNEPDFSSGLVLAWSISTGNLGSTGSLPCPTNPASNDPVEGSVFLYMDTLDQRTARVFIGQAFCRNRSGTAPDGRKFCVLRVNAHWLNASTTGANMKLTISIGADPVTNPDSSQSVTAPIGWDRYKCSDALFLYLYIYSDNTFEWSGTELY